MIKKFLQKIFKIATYAFFQKIYGKIESSIEFKNDDRIKVNIINIDKSLNYRVFITKEGRLYTDRVHDTAVIIDNKIVDGPSFQLRNNNNSKITNNIVFEKGTPRKLKILNGSVLSLLTGGGGNSNYWHWIYDVLPRLNLIEKIEKLESIDYFLFPSLKEKFQMDTIKELNIPHHKLLSSEKFRHIKTKELITTDHPYVVTNDAHKDVQNIPEWIIKWLRKKFLSNSMKSIKNYPKNIYIDRSDSKSNVAHMRSLINEDEVKNFLIKKNFTFLRLNELNFSEQVQYFNNAEYIIGLHGAGFANLVFCNNNTKVIEFRMNETGKVIENLAKNNNLKFNSIICKPVSEERAKQIGHIKIPLNLLEQKMNDI